MTDKQQIEMPVAAPFEIFQKDFFNALQSEIPTIQSAIQSIQLSNGKFIRPLLLLLTAEACGKATQISIDSAVLLELLHTASLIHDDVVDDTKQRRGVPSMNAIFDNRVAVLVGDFILAEALTRAVNTGEIQIVSIVASLCRNMAEGEVKQLENADQVILFEKDYLIALEKKTAALLASCAEIGAITAGADLSIQLKSKEFGKLLGCAFQIKDDIFDYFDNLNTGKPSGNDIREGKVTLPLIFALESANENERQHYLKIINSKEFSADNISSLIQFAKNKGGIEYAEIRMKEYRNKAVEIIQSFPDSDAKNSLLILSDYLITRNK